MQLVERHLISRNHNFWRECDHLSFQSKHLFNSANFVQRQQFFKTGKYFNSIDIYHQTKDLEAYKYLPSKVSKQIVRRVSEAWKGWLAALKDWSKHPNKYLGKPKIRKYKDKKYGRNILIYPIDSLSKPALAKGIVKLSQTNIELTIKKAHDIDQVRIVPKLDHYIIEVVYTVPDKKPVEGGYLAGVDLGLNNLMAVTSNRSGTKPMLVNGRPLKSINQFFNKRLAKAQSKKAYKQIKALNGKRERRVDNYLHTVSRRVIEWCKLSLVTHLIIGNNQGWKQEIKIGKINNQNFTKIPHSRLIEMLKYKAQLAGIAVTITEESYTSKASALDGDYLPTFANKDEAKTVFRGKRIKRGLYKTSTGRLINADTNGSINIARKVSTDAFEVLVGLPFIPVTLNLWDQVTNDKSRYGYF